MATTVETAYARRARYYSSADGFNIKRPRIPAHVFARESLATRFEASGEIYYVIAGSGETTWGSEAIGWDAGDVFCLPGGVTATHRASTRDAVLWIVTNEPELAFERAQAPRPGQAPVEAVHYPGGEIRHQLELIHRLPADK